MPLNLRSLAAKSLPVVSRRNFSVCPLCKNELKRAGSKKSVFNFFKINSPFRAPFHSGTSILIGLSAYCCSQIYNCWQAYPMLKSYFAAQEVRHQRYYQWREESEAEWRRISMSYSKKE